MLSAWPCQVVVHHGGAGTLNASARSGRPTVVAPIFVDQPGHAGLVNENGFGVGLKYMQKDRCFFGGELVTQKLNKSGFQRQTDFGPKRRNQTKETHCVGYFIMRRHPLLPEIMSQEKVMERKTDKHRYLKSLGAACGVLHL